MYGLLIIAVQDFVEQHFGPALWPIVVERAGLRVVEFKTQKRYPDTVIKKIVDALSSETGLSVKDLRYLNGTYFASYITQHGFKNLLRVYGRTFIYFLRNLDDIHEPMRFSYPRLRAPSFSVLYESPSLIRFLYSSKRTGFDHYVRGQLVNLAKSLFDINIFIKIVSKKKDGPVYHVTYEITHDGKGWEMPEDLQLSRELHNLGTTMRGSEFFKLSSFYLLLDRQLRLVKSSPTFKRLDATLELANFSEKFAILRPYIEPTFENLKLHRYNTFEIALVSSMKVHGPSAHGISVSQAAYRFKGQMCFADDWDMALFLGSPILWNTQQLQGCGLYISDLNMFDRSMDLVLAGDQQSEVLMTLYKREVDQCKQLEKSMRRVNKMHKLTNELLFQCIPRGVAKKLQNGTPAMETIQAYDSVSICFTKVVDFGAKCVEISAQQIVELLNQMYTLFDTLTEMHKVYKPDKIHISQSFADALAPYPYVFKYRGKMSIKGKGEMDTYFVEGRAPDFTILDNFVGIRRSFADVLKEDLYQADDSKSGQSTTEVSTSDELSDTASEDDNFPSDSRSQYRRLLNVSKHSSIRQESIQQSEPIYTTEAVESAKPTGKAKLLKSLNQMIIPANTGPAQATKVTPPLKLRRQSGLEKAGKKRKVAMLANLEMGSRVIDTQHLLQQAADRLATATGIGETQQQSTCGLESTHPTEVPFETDAKIAEITSDDNDEINYSRYDSDSSTESSSDGSKSQDARSLQYIHYTTKRSSDLGPSLSVTAIIDTEESARGELEVPDTVPKTTK
ncbi:unnamed protein product [Dicrocoelium dendriticum]|nr:unnamed protein product [Dicrocoelium dendriticum]